MVHPDQDLADQPPRRFCLTQRKETTMSTPSSAAIIAASRDSDLLARAVALGATIGLTQADVEAQRTKLASAPADGDGATIASVYEYASATYTPTPRPGENPAAVTDAHLLHALGAIKEQSIGA